MGKCGALADKQDDSFNASKAEVFEALGHPTRIRLLQTLSERPLPFSELKRAAGLDSNGLLSFHLGKLSGLVRLNPEGAYALTDEGREALRIVEASRTSTAGGKPSRPALPMPQRKAILAGFVLILVALGSVAVYQQSRIEALNGDVSSILTTSSFSTSSLATNGGCTSPYPGMSTSTSTAANGTTLTIAEVPVLLLNPGTTGEVCVRYYEFGEGSGYSGSAYTRIDFGQNVNSTATPSSVSLSPGSATVATVTYSVTASPDARGFDGLLVLQVCPDIPLAVGYVASQVNASDFSWYFAGSFCSAIFLSIQIVGYTNMNLAYMTYDYRQLTD